MAADDTVTRHSGIAVSVGELLEVMGIGVTEAAVWALLNQAVKPLQALIAQVQQKRLGVELCAFTPDALLMFSDGTVDIQLSSFDETESSERFRSPTVSGHADSNLVYSLGAVLWYALEYCPSSSDAQQQLRRLDASPELLSLLNLMQVADSNIRPTVGRLKQMVKQQLLDKAIDPIDVISKLHYGIIGDESELGELDIGSMNGEDSKSDDIVDALANIPDTVIDVAEVSASPPTPTKEPLPVLMKQSDADFAEGPRTPTAFRFPSNATSERSPAAQWISFETPPRAVTPEAATAIPPPRRYEPFSGAADSTSAFPPTCSRASFEGRSCHSLNCQFCSPAHSDVITAAGGVASLLSLEEKRKRSLPNLNGGRSIGGYSEEEREQRAESPMIARDPFGGSFEALTRLPMTAELRRTDDADYLQPLVIRKKVRMKKLSTDSEYSDARIESLSAPFVGEMVEERVAPVQLAKPIPAPRSVAVTKKRVEETDTSTVTPSALLETSIQEARDSKTVEVFPEATALISEENRQPIMATVADANQRDSLEKPTQRKIDEKPPSFTSRKPPLGVAAAQAPGSTSFDSTTGKNRLDVVKARSSNASRTSSQSRKMGGPEFIFKGRLPSIRLKAPAVKRRTRLLSLKAEQSNVKVVLLNGQQIDVTCQTDAQASDVFELVVGHINLNENFFFGLTVLKDGEHFFLEQDQKLYKFAPPGWKHPRRHLSAKNVYTLYLRMKNYPTSLDFVKTDQTLHEMYLQLRRDAIDERMRVERDQAYEMASLALQAEYGDRPQPPSSDHHYFHPEHYLPPRNIKDEYGGEDRVRTVLSELHSQYTGMSTKEAEVEFLKMCQKQREYGIHFHRVYKSKPALHLGNTPLGDPDTGVPLWLGVKPQGLIIFEERRAKRLPISQHRWQDTESLQFDKKRFVILTQTQTTDATTEPTTDKLIFFTDDYKKSSYFVRFAASQHRFCMKMRSWATTLIPDSMAKPADNEVCVDRRQQQRHVNSVGSDKSADSGVPDISREPSPDEKLPLKTPPDTTADDNNQRPNVSLYTPRGKTTSVESPSSYNGGARVIDTSIVTHDRTTVDPSDVVVREDDSIMHRLDEQAFRQFNTQLIKHASQGLGLTLVDGVVNGVRGVYVKSLTPGAPAELQGRLQVGDRLLSINGIPLADKNRHDAVGIVRDSGTKVDLQLERLRQQTTNGTPDVSSVTVWDEADTSHRGDSIDSAAGLGTSSARQRAHSDLCGDQSAALPSLDSSDLISSQLERRHSLDNKHKRPSASKSVTLPSNLKEVAETTSPVADVDRLNVTAGGGRRSNATGSTNTMSSSVSSRSSGEFRISDHHHNITDSSMGVRAAEDSANSSSVFATAIDASATSDAMNPSRIYAEGARRNSRILYQSHASSSDEEGDGETAVYGSKGTPTGVDSEHRRGFDLEPDYQSTPIGAQKNGLNQQQQPPTLASLRDADWTNSIGMRKELPSSDESEEEPELEYFSVVLNKDADGGLGLKIAGGQQRSVYIKALVKNPALSCENLRPGDRLLAVNGEETMDATHQEVVEMLRDAISPVTLRLARQLAPRSPTLTVETLSVRLEKSPTGSLGLSLAKLTNGEGIFIRMITAGGAAHNEGSLRVGDRLWEFNGESVVAEASPLDVIDKIKASAGTVTLVVKRFKKAA